MDTLCSTSLSPTRDPKKSDRLYFDKYQYCLSFRLTRATVLRRLGKDEVHDIRTYITERFIAQTRWGNLGSRYPHRDDVSEELYRHRTLNDLIAVAQALLPHLETMRLMVCGHYMYLYSNNLAALQALAEIPQFTVGTQLRQIEVNRPINTVMLRNSLYLKRSYFRERWIDAKSKEAVKNFLTRQDDIRLSPALKSCLDGNNVSYRGETLMQRYFFFDHNSDSTSVMLELIAPGTIRRTVPVLTK